MGIKMNYCNRIQSYIDTEIEVLQKLNVEEINAVINELETARNREADIYIFGNGGSAATASHFCGDFNRQAPDGMEGKRYRFHCLSDNTPAMMAIANDVNYEEVFREQLIGVLRREDLVIGISGSGNSANVINAVKYAKKTGCTVIGITGYHGGQLKKLSDFHLDAQVDDMQISEDVHMIFDHLIIKCIGSNCGD